MKLLILSQYFPPETGAPQNRLYELAIRLKKLGVDVTILTAMPNYPAMKIFDAYVGKKYVYEELQGLKVHRSAIYVSKKRSITARLRNYFSFVLSSARTSRKINGNFDFLLCESPPLFLGYSAMYLARQKKARLIFNVSDLWPESAEKLGVVTNKYLLRLAHRLEARLYRSSALVTGQTQGICNNINERFPEVETYWLPNGVDLDYFDPDVVPPGGWRNKHGFSETDFVFLYAGIVGIAQGLEVILHAAREFQAQKQVKFVILGEGPEKEKLIALKNSMKLTNVFFLEVVPKKMIPSVLQSVNASIIPLRKLDLFLGAIPSKIFENLAMEVPLLLGVDGEARTLFIDRAKSGLYFEPESVTELTSAITRLISDSDLATQLGKNGRQFVNEFFNRQNIAKQFYARLLKM